MRTGLKQVVLLVLFVVAGLFWGVLPLGASQGREVFIFDAGLPDAATLVGSVPQGAEVVLLRAGADGPVQIAAALEGRSGIAALHLVTHGSPGKLYLGGTVLSSENMSRYAPELETVRKAIGGSELLLYGCSVAKGDAGMAFVRALAQATGTTVAASTDPTGARAAGGNSFLEFATGPVTSRFLAAIDRYPHTLAVYDFASNAQGWTGDLTWWNGFGAQAIISGTANTEVNSYPPSAIFITTMDVRSYVGTGQDFHMYAMYQGVVKYSATITTSTTWTTHTINQNLDRIRFVNDIGGGNGWFYPAIDNVSYNPPGPNVSGISPVRGPTGGGTVVTLTGTNFTGATAVKFGATNASSFTVNSATQITATSPAGAAGTVHITVTTASGTSGTSTADQFTYVAAPTVTGVNPTSGPSSGGTSVTITGTNLGATAVMFNGTSAINFNVLMSTTLTATVPTLATSGPISVTTPGGTVTSSSNFTVLNHTVYLPLILR